MANDRTILAYAKTGIGLFATGVGLLALDTGLPELVGFVALALAGVGAARRQLPRPAAPR